MILIVAILAVGILWRGQRSSIGGIVGVSFWLYAAWVGLAGVRDLGKSLTPMPRPRETGMLVTDGIYARLRHPLYSAVMAMGFGWGVGWSSGAAFLLAVVLAGFLNVKARHEERMLRERYPGYEDYSNRVPRFLPKLR